MVISCIHVPWYLKRQLWCYHDTHSIYTKIYQINHSFTLTQNKQHSLYYHGKYPIKLVISMDGSQALCIFDSINSPSK